jgi:hypothetical protein
MKNRKERASFKGVRNEICINAPVRFAISVRPTVRT